MTEIEKEITLKAHEACKKHDSSAYYRYGYQDGAKWMYEKMQESNEGQALLYAVEKTVERTRKETLLEVLNWIEGMYDTDYVAGDIVMMLKEKLKKLNNDPS